MPDPTNPKPNEPTTQTPPAGGTPTTTPAEDQKPPDTAAAAAGGTDPKATAPPPDVKPPAATAPKPELTVIRSAEDIDALLASGKGSAILPQSQMKALKTKFETKGRDAALADMAAMAKASGYASVEEMVSAAKTAKANGGKPPMIDVKSKEAVAAAQKERDEAVRRANDADIREKARMDEFARQEAELHVREQVLVAGVNSSDSDYVADRLKRHIAGLDEAAFKAFDENSWFAELRKEKPYLFQEQVVKPTTGTGGGNPKTPDNKPGDGPKAFNALTASRQEFLDHTRKKGYKMSGSTGGKNPTKPQ